MAKASDYPVGFGYGATDGYYYGPSGIVGKYHRGNDFYTPAGTDLVVNGVVIGKTGATGTVSGPHVHVQLSPEANPSGREWDVPGGVVSETGKTAVEGNYIKVKGSDGYTRMYFHLSQIFVAVGQKIGGDDVIQDKDNEFNRWNDLFIRIRGRSASRDEFRNAAVGQTWLRAIEILTDGSSEAADAQNSQEVGQIAKRDNWQGQIEALKKERDDILYPAIEKYKIDVSSLNDRVKTLEGTVKSLNDTAGEDKRTIKDLTAQLAVQSDDTKLLNSFGELLSKLIARLGVKKG